MPLDPITRIGRSLVISGDVDSDDDILIDGDVRGFVHLREATLTIGPEGRVEGDIRAARVVVHGTVEGTIAATQRLELTASARVAGSLSANQVVLQDGARFSGHVDMDRRTIAARVARFKAAAREPAGDPPRLRSGVPPRNAQPAAQEDAGTRPPAAAGTPSASTVSS